MNEDNITNKVYECLGEVDPFDFYSMDGFDKELESWVKNAGFSDLSFEATIEQGDFKISMNGFSYDSILEDNNILDRLVETTFKKVCYEFYENMVQLNDFKEEVDLNGLHDVETTFTYLGDLNGFRFNGQYRNYVGDRMKYELLTDMMGNENDLYSKIFENQNHWEFILDSNDEYKQEKEGLEL